MEFDPKKVTEAANAYGEAEDSDVLLLTGPLDDAAYKRLKTELPPTRRKHVLMVLITWGGDAHSAYRIGRCLQRKYDEVRVYVPGACKSAGTLLAISGHKLLLSDDGELGPIDVQQMRQDDLWERTSGLIESSALESLGQVSWDMFERLVTEIKDMSLGRITFKTAADAAAPIVNGVLNPIAAQIDPLKVGETSRALQIASQYAEILNKTAKNLQRMAIQKLATGYPDHGFIIDREEAETLFNNVAVPNEMLEKLSDNLGSILPTSAGTIFLNREIEPEAASEDTNNGIEAETDGVKKAIDDAGPPNADLADVKKDPAGDREVGAANGGG